MVSFLTTGHTKAPWPAINKSLPKGFLMSKMIKAFVAVSALALVTACGGGGGGGVGSTTSDNTNNTSDPTVSPNAILVGKLIDAPTAGVSYVCGNQRGKTDTNGNFNFENDKSCTFSIGKVTLGSMTLVPADKNVTPYDLVNVSRLSKIDPYVTGIAQLLQNLDDKTTSGVLTINTNIERNFENLSEKNLSIFRDHVRGAALNQLIIEAGALNLIDRATALQNMESYFESIAIDRAIRVKKMNLDLPTSSSRFQYLYRYGWQKTDEYALKLWCDMNGNPPNCTPTYYIDGCRSYNGTCTKTNSFEQIADNSSGYFYRAYPILPDRSFNAKYLGLGIGGGLPEFVKIYSSQIINWSNSYTPSSGEGPNTLLANSTTFDTFFSGSTLDYFGNSHQRHPGVNDKSPGFQAYLGKNGVSIEANKIYWIVAKYADTGIRNEKCLDHIGPNQFKMPSNFSADTLLQYGTSTGNGFAYFLMSKDGIAWEPADMLSGGVCNTFLAN